VKIQNLLSIVRLLPRKLLMVQTFLRRWEDGKNLKEEINVGSRKNDREEETDFKFYIHGTSFETKYEVGSYAADDEAEIKESQRRLSLRYRD
jgi:hypothetical protein